MNHSEQSISKDNDRESKLRLERSKAPKLRYEKPMIMWLGDVGRGIGGCILGSYATGNCTNGLTIGTPNCNIGNIVIK
jgi:hypothetical protein